MSATALTPIIVASPYGKAPTGVAEAEADTGNGNSFANDGRTRLLARNSDSSDHAFTVRGKSFTVPAGKSIILGPFPVFEQYGTTVEVTGNDTHLTFIAYSTPHGVSAKR
jgi:hypothetical protein